MTFISNETIGKLYVKLYVNLCVVDLRLRAQTIVNYKNYSLHRTNLAPERHYCIIAKKRQRHLSLTKQVTGGLANKRQSEIKNPFGRPYMYPVDAIIQLLNNLSMVYVYHKVTQFKPA